MTDAMESLKPGSRIATSSRSVFSRVVVGIDGSEPGFEACRQAARLVEPDGSIELFAAVHLARAARTGWSATRVANDLQREAEQALREAQQIAGPHAVTKLYDGPPEGSLSHELTRQQATLLAIGTHGHSRAEEIVLGGVAGTMLHVAPCSVLVARPPDATAMFPRAIAVGVDGSPEADAALAAAQHLSRRFSAPLRIVTALGGKHVDLAHVHLRNPYVELKDEHPVDALVDAAASADLLVVGSRGLHGLRSLGSVSERVAHRATASVLVVRHGT
jgi:nucleotide-binding universal stress UspA family protein